MDVVDSIFWLKNYLFRPYAIRQYKKALSNIENKDTVCSVNWNKRIKLIRFAYENIPFYKKYYDANGFNPSMLKEKSDWDLVPILEKKEVLNHLEEMKNQSVPKRSICPTQTGGSTGTPLKFYVDKRFCKEIQQWRMFKNIGVSPASNVAIVHRRVPSSFLSKLKNRVLWWPTRRVYLNVCSLTDSDIKRFVEDIIKKKVVWIQGYVGGLEKVADYIIENKYQINTVKLVWSTSAPLFPIVRMKLEKAFNCIIMNQYGCCEVWNIAMQCQMSENLHISYDFVHVDVVNRFGKDVFEEEGDILVTDLENYACPLIKYRLGDRGTLTRKMCKCGTPLPLLKTIKGRISDSIYTPSGIYVSGEYLTTIFDSYPLYFSQYQVYQHSDYSIDINVKLARRDSQVEVILDAIKDKVEHDTHGEVPVQINVVDRIHDDKGKIRYILSEVSIRKYRQTIE